MKCRGGLEPGLAFWDSRNQRVALGTSLLLKGAEHAIRSKREEGHAHAKGVCDSIRDGRARRDHRRLAQSDDAALIVSLARHHANHQFWNVTQPGKTVPLHVGIEHVSGRRIEY